MPPKPCQEQERVNRSLDEKIWGWACLRPACVTTNAPAAADDAASAFAIRRPAGATPKIVLKVASLYCRDADERRDLAQEITMQLWRAFPSYDEARPFSTWMYRIALNVAISFARS